jgi:hypothetical protein
VGNPNHLPEAVGIEQEHRAQVDGYELGDKNSKQVVASIIRLSGGGVNGYTQRGGRVYFDTKGPETATGECRTPREVVSHARADYATYVDALSAIVLRTSDTQGRPIKAQTNQRVRDTQGNTWAVHDSLSLTEDATETIRGYGVNHQRILAHAAARSFIVGTGLVTPKACYYSQKRAQRYQPEHLEAYRFGPTVYKVRTEFPPDSRFESRDNDANISDWAAQVRVAGTGGLLALMQTPLIAELPWEPLANYLIPSPGNRINIMHLTPEGFIDPSEATWAAVTFEKALAELMMEQYGKYGEELTPQYKELFEEQYTYCEDFARVLRHEVTIDILKDRSDIGAKFSMILKGIVRDTKAGLACSLNDSKSVHTDMAYGRIGIVADAGAAKKEDRVQLCYGFGHELRRRGAFRLTIPQSAVDHAAHTPPDTRAAERAQLMRSGTVNTVTWRAVSVDGQMYKLSKILGGNLTAD